MAINFLQESGQLTRFMEQSFALPMHYKVEACCSRQFPMFTVFELRVMRRFHIKGRCHLKPRGHFEGLMYW